MSTYPERCNVCGRDLKEAAYCVSVDFGRFEITDKHGYRIEKIDRAFTRLGFTRVGALCSLCGYTLREDLESFLRIRRERMEKNHWIRKEFEKHERRDA